MKITLYYEDKLHPTFLEVSEEECTVMVETDYRQRLNAAEDKNAVQRRTAQEILDAEVNAPTFRRNRTETRRHVHLSADDLDRRRADAMRSFITPLRSFVRSSGSFCGAYFGKVCASRRLHVRRAYWKVPYRSGCGASISGSENSCPTRKIFSKNHEVLHFPWLLGKGQHQTALRKG